MPAGEKPSSDDKSLKGEKLFRVRDNEDKLTLAAAVRKWLGGEIPWSQAERLIRTRRAIVNGNLCIDPARRLKQGDLVKLLEHSLAPPASEDDVVIRHLDAHVVVVEKPSGMTSVRHAEEREWSNKRRRANPTLEDLLPRIIAKKLAGKKKAIRGEATISRTPPVRPVHRLDRDTSGLIIFARTVPAERHLGEQFRAHTTSRRYLAIVKGRVTERTIDTQFVRDRGDGRRGSVNEADEGKRAVTHVRPIEHLDGYTLVECRLETGRTHQIRIHMSESGHPVCGEKVYGQAKFADKNVDTSGAPRLALHAAELGFKHPSTGEWLEFHTPLPKDLREFLDRLRRKGSSGAAPKPQAPKPTKREPKKDAD
jgi:23S rRNA pseudouridine1911/1915/1917 synthase